MRDIIISSINIFKGIVASPSKTFKDMQTDGTHDYPVYILFLTGSFVTLIKSFYEKKYYLNFFETTLYNNVLSFFSIPQIRWLISYLCFGLLILLVCFFCNLILKECDKKKIVLCFLSISSIGILLQILFFIIPLFLSHQYVHLLKIASFFWIICLSNIGIKRCQKATWVKTVAIYVLSGIPAFIISGLAGVAPFLLFLGTSL